MATDKLFHQYSMQYGSSLLRLLEIEDFKDYKASSYTVKDIERRSDVVFENQKGKERAIWIEFQGYRDEFVFYRLTVAMAMYCQEQNFVGEIKPVVIFLKHSHLKAARMLFFHYEGRQYLVFEPEVIVLGKKSVNELHALGDVRLIPLYPLCDIAPDEIKAHSHEWAEEIQKMKQLSNREKSNILSLLGGFISHRIRKLSLKDINKLLGDFKMEDTQVGKDLIEIGIEKGREKGREEGLEKGLEKGKRETLLNLLSHKFGKIPQAVIKDINSISDKKKLDDLAIKVFELTDLGQLKKLLN